MLRVARALALVENASGARPDAGPRSGADGAAERLGVRVDAGGAAFVSGVARDPDAAPEATASAAYQRREHRGTK